MQHWSGAVTCPACFCGGCAAGPITTVGDEKRTIDFDLFVEAHTHLADYYKALGLEGDRLDLAIVEALPDRLAQILEPQTLQ
ncbi:MAG: hypothetical protein WAM03_24800 [Pseudolabrys sp.]